MATKLLPTEVTVIVLNWNGFDDTKKCVQSLLCQEGVGVRVVLVDNNSEPEERKRLVDTFKDNESIQLILNDANLGFGKAHNRVFEQLFEEGNSWVACLNNDAFAEPKWLIKMIERAQKESCAMVACKMLAASNDRLLDNAGHFMLNTGEIIPKGFGEPAEDYSHSRQTLGPCAGACLYDLHMLDRLGGFDEYFFVGYEDAELGLRAWLAGYDCFYEPESIVRHKISASLNKVRSTQYLASIQTGIFYSWFKLMPRAIVLSNLPSFLFKYGMVLLIDVFTFRFKFLNVMWMGILNAYKQRKLIKAARVNAYSKMDLARSHKAISNQLTNFLWFDIQRFWKFIVLRKKSNLEA